MSDQPYKKKLIEVALPLEAIGEASRLENQPFTRNHPRSLHTWWARRPLAACQAVIFAQLVDDPSSDPERFPTAESQEAERTRLFGIMEELVKWKNSTDDRVWTDARREILKACDGVPQQVVDPFAGGARIPLAAQRLGLIAAASDLNPVAALINKALLELPSHLEGTHPVHPEAENRSHWPGATGLAEDARLYATWMRDEGERRIGHLYPSAQHDGRERDVIAWLWARTVKCPNPACGTTMPLISSMWLRKKKGRETWLYPIVDGSAIRFEVRSGPEGPPEPSKLGRGAKFRCFACGETAPEAYLHDEAVAGRFGAQLISTVLEGDRERIYQATDDLQEQAALVPLPDHLPPGDMPPNPRWFSPPAFGLQSYTDLFTARQLTALTTLCDLVSEAKERVRQDCQASGQELDAASQRADAVATYLALAVSRWADIGNSIATWNNSNESIRNLFARQAIPMTWDFAEANPFRTAVSFLPIFENALGSFEVLGGKAPSISMEDARTFRRQGIVSTDPPYYDNVGYADLSDFFYVWLRRSLGDVHPELFRTILTPKNEELIATPYRHGGSRAEASKYFEDGFVEVFRHARSQHDDRFPMTVYYAFKQSERRSDAGITSTGWSTMLEGLIFAGWMVTATWPIRTERAERSVGQGTNALASSVVLACRARPDSAGVTDRQGLLRALNAELPGPLRDLRASGIAPVDLRQAAIGPGMAVYSRFSRVVEPGGDRMTVRTALGLINQVLERIMGEQEADFDPETRWAIQWFSQFFESSGDFGLAEQLAVSMNVAVEGLRQAGIVESGGGNVRLLGRGDLPENWDPVKDDRLTVWEATQHLVRRLEADGEVEAGRLLRQLAGMGESCKTLAYRLFDVCESVQPNLAGPYNALAASWPEIQRLASTMSEPVGRAEQQSFDT